MIMDMLLLLFVFGLGFVLGMMTEIGDDIDRSGASVR
jgi:hypothetical protein